MEILNSTGGGGGALPKRGQTTRYLSKRQFAERIGAKDPTLAGYKLPPPNVTIGPVNEDGSLPRGTVQGWTEERIDRWQANRPGRGARTDLR